MTYKQQITDNSVASEVTELLETVIDGGYCIGCGACASISDSPLKMQLDEYPYSVTLPKHLPFLNSRAFIYQGFTRFFSNNKYNTHFSLIR